MANLFGNTDINVDDISQAAKHTLFVEGKDDNEIDAVAIKILLNSHDLDMIEVKTMGGCDNVRNAAQALFLHHPHYYFLVDRDDKTREEIDKSWQNFPDSKTYNLLIWHKRELENYFIDPDYIEKSRYLKSGINIRQRLLDECQRRLFMDAANLTLSRLKYELREVSLTKTIFKEFANFNLFKKQTDGLLELNKRTAALNNQWELAKVFIHTAEQIYTDVVEELTGGVLPLEYGCGSWLERMSGKEIFRQIANQCFEVMGNSGLLQGKMQNNQIAKALVKLPLIEQPEDFQELVKLLKNRLA